MLKNMLIKKNHEGHAYKSCLSLLTAHCSLLIFLCSLLFALLSCKTTPKSFDAILNDTHLPLDRGASVYIVANAKQARPIINLLPIEELKDKQAAQMIDMTDFLVAALFPPSSNRHFQLTAWGNYPSSGASLALGSSRQWEKKNTSQGDIFWYSKASGLSMSLTAKQAFAISSTNRQPIEPAAAAPGVETPDGFGEFARGAPLSCWMDNPSPVITRVFNEAGVPIRFPVQQVFINIYPIKEGQFETIIRMQFENASQARGAAAMLSMAAAFVSADLDLASIFLSNPPVQNDRNLEIKTAVLSEEDMKVLLSILF